MHFPELNTSEHEFVTHTVTDSATWRVLLVTDANVSLSPFFPCSLSLSLPKENTTECGGGYSLQASFGLLIWVKIISYYLTGSSWMEASQRELPFVFFLLLHFPCPPPPLFVIFQVFFFDPASSSQVQYYPHYLIRENFYRKCKFWWKKKCVAICVRYTLNFACQIENVQGEMGKVFKFSLASLTWLWISIINNDNILCIMHFVQLFKLFFLVVVLECLFFSSRRLPKSGFCTFSFVVCLFVCFEEGCVSMAQRGGGEALHLRSRAWGESSASSAG